MAAPTSISAVYEHDEGDFFIYLGADLKSSSPLTRENHSNVWDGHRLSIFVESCT